MTRHHIAMLIASVTVFLAAMVMLAIGPSDIDHAADVAADLADAQAAALTTAQGRAK